MRWLLLYIYVRWLLLYISLLLSAVLIPFQIVVYTIDGQ